MPTSESQTNFTSIKQNTDMYKEYKYERRILFIITLLGSVLPLGMSCIVGYHNGGFSFTKMLLNGDIVLSLYTLTIPSIINIFSIKIDKDTQLINAFVIGIILFFFQTVFYILVRYETSENLWMIIIVTIIFVLSSWICCCNSLKTIIIYKKNHEEELKG